jgi:hypothetical protein
LRGGCDLLANEAVELDQEGALVPDRRRLAEATHVRG